ncbi:MAG: leucine-rich repeat domain-containing protein, partial [Planctomycetota bacterium]|nr:leucine-rich repeat domain-containing protein [Planctomycetota bacterium]
MQLVLIAILALQGQQEPTKLKLPMSTTDEQLAEKLNGLSNLKELDLSYNTRITDAGLVHLKGLPKLEKLDL